MLLMRIAASLSHLNTGTDNYLKHRKTEKGFTKQRIKASCKINLLKLLEDVVDVDNTPEIDAAVKNLSRDQIVASIWIVLSSVEIFCFISI
jgi:hypothetical protein